MGKDRRTCKKLPAKYGKGERDRTGQSIHKVTEQIVVLAREDRLGIKMENMKGIRRLYRKGSRSPSFRCRMKAWVFEETQRQIDYKARWAGVPVRYVNPRGTSSYCLCGSPVVPLADRKLYCPKCDKTGDRDDLASKKIMACAVPQARPSRGRGEGEPRKQEDAGNPRSRWREG
ncbi:MAG: IS200/IS605 family accessory protein TnpB-related protein [Nitrososphaerota archaeon]|nr:IS200/IS605 family accessory protein TnpB-related protein [Nitrososphaerota archaeon]MDG7023412.1 IS200/IS605 family accessory protein TnpB-related protein [Nitrososphaerota archaeon]